MLNGAAPAFVAPDGGLLLALVRAATVAALISVFGTLAFLEWVVPRAAPRLGPAPAAAARRLARCSAAAGIVALAVWLLLESAAMAGATDIAELFSALPTVAADTRFGHVAACQAAALLLCLLAVAPEGWRLHFATVAAGAALLMQTGHGHALAMADGPSVLLAAGMLHLLGAGLWLGGVAPLALVVRGAPAAGGMAACRWFSPLGQAGIVLVVGSAIVQGWVLVGGVPGLAGTAYGWVAMVKIALLAALLWFAWRNRYRLAPALAAGPRAKGALLRSLAWQTLAGMLVVGAASVLSSLPPGMHTQPVWPFTLRFSLDAVRAEADLAHEALTGALLLAGAVLLLAVAALLRRRVRWLALPAAGVAAWLALPHLDLLFVPAVPTSFFQSPTGFSAVSIVRGAALYPARCAACHGAGGHGDGMAADLTAAHLWQHSDGELFWWLTHGIDAPEGNTPAMPGFGGVLSEDDRWALIDYIRGHNAGLVARAEGHWSPPLRAPDFPVRCADGMKMLADLRGGFVRLVFGGATAEPGVTTVAVGGPGDAPPAAGLCVADDAAVPGAYAVVTGAAVAGTQVLVDGDGWLRSLRTMPTAAAWNDPAILAAELRDLATHPPPAAGGMAGMAM